MCPYCGEDVPGESEQCWKCGSALTGEGAEELTDGQLDRMASAGSCPSCQSPMGPNRRCSTCGWVARDRARRVSPVHGAFFLVACGVLFGLVLGIYRRDTSEGRATPIPYSYEQLVEIYASEADDSGALADSWAQHHRGRYVLWDMVILGIDDAGTLKLAPEGATEPVVHLTLQNSDEIDSRGLKAEKRIKYSAALKGYSGKTIFLTSGLVEDDG